MNGYRCEVDAILSIVPTLLRAATVNVYAVPFVRPVTVRVVADEVAVIGVCGTPPTNGVIR